MSYEDEVDAAARRGGICYCKGSAGNELIVPVDNEYQHLVELMNPSIL